jgi:SPP1 gp7 family putative phage head morphogenesis protein
MKEALKILTGDLAMSAYDAQQVLEAFSTRLGTEFGAAVAPDVKSLMDLSYRDGKKFIVEPKDLTFNIAIADETAIAWLQEHHIYWINGYYDKNISDMIAEIIEIGMQEGLSRVEIGDDLKRFFDSYPGLSQKPDVYWRGMAANGMNRSRNVGMIQGYQEVGITMLEFMAVMDERTSDVCREMNGRRFPVATAADQRDKMMGAATPEQAIEYAPWPKIDDIKDLRTSEINAKGVVMPPLHYHCRSTVVEVS